VFEQDALHLQYGAGVAVDLDVVLLDDRFGRGVLQMGAFEFDDAVAAPGDSPQHFVVGEYAHDVVILDARRSRRLPD
jgi:hypothetical protein